MKSFVASTFLARWEDPHGQYFIPIHVYGCVDPILQPIYLYTRFIQRFEPPRYPRRLDAYLLAELPNPLPNSGLRDPMDLRLGPSGPPKAA
jgi:hypothetical protein